MVGGRSYNQSQYNRAIALAPAAGIGLQAVRLSRRRSSRRAQTGAPTSRRRRSSTTSRRRSSSTIRCGRRRTTRTSTTARSRSAARSRTRATSRRSRSREAAGYDRVAALWKKLGVGTPPQAVSVDRARRVRGDAARDRDRLHAVPERRHDAAAAAHPAHHAAAARTSRKTPQPTRATVARPDTTFLVTNMMRSVLNEGTGAGARAAGFTLDAAGKTGTTNDLRDAWFVGFTPELLTVVWVGFDDNQPLGLSGAQAALPIWTQFMTRALAGHAQRAVRRRPTASPSSTSTPIPASSRRPTARGSSAKRSSPAPSRAGLRAASLSRQAGSADRRAWHGASHACRDSSPPGHPAAPAHPAHRCPV